MNVRLLRSIVEITGKSELVGWRCSDCQWEYRLEAPMRRESLPFDMKMSAEQLHYTHDCHHYGKKATSS